MQNRKTKFIIAGVVSVFLVFTIFLLGRYPAGFITGFAKLPLENTLENNLERAESGTSPGKDVKVTTKFHDLGEISITNGNVVVLEIMKEI